LHRHALTFKRYRAKRFAFVFHFDDFLNALRDDNLVLLRGTHQPRRGVDRVAKHIVLAPSARIADFCHEGRTRMNADQAVDFGLAAPNHRRDEIHNQIADGDGGGCGAYFIVGVGGWHAEIDYDVRAGKVVGDLF